MAVVLAISVGMFVFFFARLMWAQRVRPQSQAAARRRGRMLVTVGWGVLGLVFAAIAAARGNSAYVVAGVLLATVNALFFWRVYRKAVR